ALPLSTSTRRIWAIVSYVADSPRCVASYGVMPQTYIVATGPGDTGIGAASAVSCRVSGTGAPATKGTDGMGHECMPETLHRLHDADAQQHHHQDAHRDAVRREPGEGMVRHELQQPGDGRVGDA